MNEDVLAMFLTFVAGMATLFCVTGVVVTLIKRRSYRLPESDIIRRLEEVSDRLGRLDNSVDAMAVEVERISEAQRFTARVLADRAKTGALPDRNRIGTTTPH